MRFPRSLPTLLLLALLLVLMTGCRAGVRAAAAEAPHAAVPVAVDELLKAGEDARTRERVALVLETPEMKRVIAEIARSAVAAALVEASSDASQERIAELTHVVARALAQSLASDVVPAVVAGTRESLRENVSASDVRALQNAVGSIAAASTTAAIRAAAKEIPTSVAPAVRESLARELQEPGLHEAVGGLVDDATRRAVASSHQALTDTQEQKAAAGKPGIIERARRLVTLSWGLAIALALFAATLVAWTLRTRRQTKRYRGALLELVTRQERGEETDPTRVRRLFELLR